MQKTENKKIHAMAVAAVMTAVTCVLGPMSIAIGPIPITLTNFAIYLSLCILGWKLGTVSLAVYLLIGAVGLPVFSAFSGGIGKLLGPTGGYLVGFLPMALIAGWFIDRFDNKFLRFVGMVLGTAVCYALGTAWFCHITGNPLGAALGLCVYPFIPLDLAKMVVALVIGSVIRARLVSAGILHQHSADTQA